MKTLPKHYIVELKNEYLPGEDEVLHIADPDRLLCAITLCNERFANVTSIDITLWDTDDYWVWCPKCWKQFQKPPDRRTP